ncbi:MAG: hypothetical protein WBE94_00545 [Pseudolabrys sp.]
MLVVAAIVDQKWLKRLEQQLSGLVETSSTVPLLAHDASQFLEDEICRRRTSSPRRSTFRSSSPTSSERAPGESSRRNFRNFSTVVSAPAILGLPESSPSA